NHRKALFHRPGGFRDLFHCHWHVRLVLEANDFSPLVLVADHTVKEGDGAVLVPANPGHQLLRVRLQRRGRNPEEGIMRRALDGFDCRGPTAYRWDQSDLAAVSEDAVAAYVLVIDREGDHGQQWFRGWIRRCEG